MNVVELIERLGAYPADTEVKLLGKEYNRCGYDLEYSGEIYFDYGSTEKILYVEGEFE